MVSTVLGGCRQLGILGMLIRGLVEEVPVYLELIQGLLFRLLFRISGC